jgi:hypothetical protein
MRTLQKLVGEGKALVLEDKHVKDGLGGWEHILVVETCTAE